MALLKRHEVNVATAQDDGRKGMQSGGDLRGCLGNGLPKVRSFNWAWLLDCADAISHGKVAQFADLKHRSDVGVVGDVALERGGVGEKGIGEGLHSFASEPGDSSVGSGLIGHAATDAYLGGDGLDCRSEEFDRERHVDVEVVVRVEAAARLVRIKDTYLDHLIPFTRYDRLANQYFWTLGSISSLQARMPPARFTTLE